MTQTEIDEIRYKLVNIIGELTQIIGALIPTNSGTGVSEPRTYEVAPSIEYLNGLIQDQLGITQTFGPEDMIELIPEMDSLDQIELVMQIEDDFAIEIDDRDAERLLKMTFAQVVEWLKSVTNTR